VLGPRPQAVLRLEGFDSLPRSHWWAQTTIVVARSRCRVRWFRLAGLPANERLAALRLQVEAWRPFANTGARLALLGEDGIALAWDASAAQQQLRADGLAPERCQFLPETLVQPAGADGLRLLRCAEGFEAQRWSDGFLRASRWWADPLTAQDWQEFVHASGAGDAGSTPPEPQELGIATGAWVKHYPLHASAEGSEGTEQRVVFAGALALTLAAGVLAHQLWDARQQGQALARQIADAKTATAPVLRDRDATMAAVDEVEKIAAWFALPLPVDVIGHLHDMLGRSGVKIKDLDLEGSKLRIGLQLTPNATRAGIVKDLQAGGWFTEVSEVRADNARGLLTMEMRVAGLRPPAEPLAISAPTPVVEAAVSPRAPAAPAPVAQAPIAAPPQPAPGRPPQPAQGPAKPILAKPDANGMPPPDVFNAIPNR
jgi:hypothetical protein